MRAFVDSPGYLSTWHTNRLTKRSSQPLAGA
jgi:hypothetical protein